MDNPCPCTNSPDLFSIIYWMRQGIITEGKALCLRQGYIFIQENSIPSSSSHHWAQYFNTIFGSQPFIADAQIGTPGIYYRPPVEVNRTCRCQHLQLGSVIWEKSSMDFKSSWILSLGLLLIHFVIFERSLPARVIILMEIGQQYLDGAHWWGLKNRTRVHALVLVHTKCWW